MLLKTIAAKQLKLLIVGPACFKSVYLFLMRFVAKYPDWNRDGLFTILFNNPNTLNAWNRLNKARFCRSTGRFLRKFFLNYILLIIIIIATVC